MYSPVSNEFPRPVDAPSNGDRERIGDLLGRSLEDLRISVTDRCNFRCTYCMPREVFGPNHAFLPRGELLTFEEVERLVRVFTRTGVRRVRITGGEPLLRPRLDLLVNRLSRITGLEEVALTTNGVLLVSQARGLFHAGLRRVTVSLDGLSQNVFRAMSNSDLSVDSVIRGIEAARIAGFNPVKINMVVRRGVNQNEILPMAERFARSGYVLRFIEYMDVGSTNGWRLEDVVTESEILETLGGSGRLELLPAKRPSETAKRYRLRGKDGEIGIISSVSAPFCRGCTRARIAANGHLHTCLFGTGVLDLRFLVRSGLSDDELYSKVREVWMTRTDRYSELRASEVPGGMKTEMSVLGG